VTVHYEDGRLDQQSPFRQDPLFGSVALCACQCGGWPAPGRKFVTGHNLHAPKTKEQREKIAASLKRAWQTRKRMPIGSTRSDHNGYVFVKTEHGASWAKQHVLVMEQSIGRKLRPGEQVHHINGVTDDNVLENLLLCSGPSDHMTVEGTFKALLPDLMAAGIVFFDHIERRSRRA
jgi:hypothetical protein